MKTARLVGPADQARLNDVQLTTVKDIKEAALEIKDDTLQEAYYTYVMKRCKKITEGFAVAAPLEEAVPLVRELHECNDLLSAALLSALLVIQFILGRQFEEVLMLRTPCRLHFTLGDFK